MLARANEMVLRLRLVFWKLLALSALVFVSTGVCATPAFAYIDPGTGATFIGSMAPLLVGVLTGAFAFLLKIFWHPLKRLFSKKTPDKTDSK